jgi:hypothetical protein
MRRLFLLAALVMFIFALIAAAATSGTFLTTAWPVWIAAGLVAYVVDQLLGDRLART